MTCCSICESEKFTRVFENAQRKVVQCDQCKHVQCIKPSKQVLIYDKEYLNHHHNWFKYPPKKIYRKIITRITRIINPQTLLDLGSGLGSFLIEARKSIPKILLTGVDQGYDSPSPDLQWYKSDFMSENELQIYDVISLISVVENYHQNLDALLIKIYRHLSDSGLIVIVTPNASSLISQISIQMSRLGWSIPAQLVFSEENPQTFSQKSLNLWLLKNGFKVIQEWGETLPWKTRDTHLDSKILHFLVNAGIGFLSEAGRLIGRPYLICIIAQKA
ncbi:MAG: class I SAM-dependent methyltransferase [Oligoflexia bacterium]|nr:class I SAM-dependent methyltransferase [Oligoflexia bacterium]